MIGVIGAGFVGSALLNAVKDCQVFVCDPKVSPLCIHDLAKMPLEMVFVCVPTPSKPCGAVDDSILREVVSQLPADMLVVVKSTITPDHLLDIAKGRRLVYNPEFLTQRTANEDFINSDMIVLGGEPDDCAIVTKFYHECTHVRPCPVFITDIATASMVKYTLNCLFAQKVIFMNEISRLHSQVAGSSWQEFTEILAADSRIGPSHLQVPGPDGHYGFGGACFPKDTKALLAYAKSLDLGMPVLEAAIEENRVIRGV